jgi:hypothetical protein
MRRTILRRLESLEKEERVREQKELDALAIGVVSIWKIVIAYHLEGLESDEKRHFGSFERENNWVGRAFQKALNYQSDDVFIQDLFGKDGLLLGKGIEFRSKHYDAYRRLFAKVGLDFDRTSSRVLFEAFVTMVNQLPERWLNWLRRNLEQDGVEIAPGSNLPRRLSCHNFIVF